MATKKKSAKASKKTSKPIKSVNFIGTWITFESRFLDTKVDQTHSSSWTFLPGNKIMEYGKVYQCKVSKNIIQIPTSSGDKWVGEMLPKSVLKISTSNGMGSFYCKKKR